MGNDVFNLKKEETMTTVAKILFLVAFVLCISLSTCIEGANAEEKLYFYVGTSSSTPEDVYIVPAGKVFRLGDVVIASGSGKSRGAQILIDGQIFMQVFLDSTTTITHTFRDVFLNEGQTLSVKSVRQGRSVYFTLSGRLSSASP
jgi:hypothetical protein